MRLNKIQKNFRDTLLDPSALNSDFRGIFKTGGISAENRMKVYRNNVMTSLTKAVIAVYPLTEKIVGPDFLKAAVAAYVIENLPDQGNLNFYGATFPGFIAGYEPAKHLSYLPDMARLEWAWEVAALADDDEPLNPDALRNIPESRISALRLHLRASVQLMESPYPLDKIVDFCRAEKPEGTLDVGSGGVHLMIFRPQLQAMMRKISEGEFIFLRALRDGNSLMTAAQWAVENDERFDLAATLQKNMELKTFRELRNETMPHES